MDLPKFARRGIVFYLQIAAAVVSLILGIASITKESAPLMKRVQENQQRAELQRQEEQARRKAAHIANMGINWQYRGNDGTWRYYSDQTGRFWFRTNIQGIQEYSESPQVQIASNPSVVR
jgi:uncharacterized membrane protein YcjF (UPF0283 family)